MNTELQLLGLSMSEADTFLDLLDKMDKGKYLLISEIFLDAANLEDIIYQLNELRKL